MAQGKGKFGAAKKSAGSQKKKAVKQKKKTSKGWKTHAAKGRKAHVAKAEQATSEAINRKNEALVSARALSAGDKFFLSDIKDSGKKELAEQNEAKTKKENKSTKVSDRLKDQLRKLGREV
eukprot:CAMPEP_0197465338 /NCGR_PEP_ID=MMETSP1175-20131217/64489_1 /TAXON_ID=1003142 /ORGANISM="Triceratium dubium, Strain CCMP147" /LENGTH=120 /DNA_ID=CAMNT_0043001349 /DNA_START=2160 /DNA_END=2522 /DNA_ORIENTATION=-